MVTMEHLTRLQADISAVKDDLEAVLDHVKKTRDYKEYRALDHAIENLLVAISDLEEYKDTVKKKVG